MRKNFVVRDRSLSTFPSKQLSVNQFMQQKSIALQTFRSKQFQESKMLTQKDQDITKLKVHLDHALKMAVNEAVQNSRSKQQSMRSTQTKLHIQKKYVQISELLSQQKMQRMKMETALAQVQYKFNKEQEEKKKIIQKLQNTNRQLEKTSNLVQKIDKLEEKITQIQPLKSRIKSLQATIRKQKIKNEQMNQNNRQLQKVIEELKEKIKLAKPYQEELLQRIAFLERVNLQLERKMQDFNRREHEYKKQVAHYKNALSKMTVERNKYKSDYESTYATLQQKLINIKQLEKTVEMNLGQIQRLSGQLDKKTEQCMNFEKKLQETIDYYQSVAEQNVNLKKRNEILQQNQTQMRRVLASHLKVSQETNLYIISRNSQILKLEDIRRTLVQNLDVIEKKFAKLDRLFEQNSARGTNEIKQSYYLTIKQRNKFLLEMKQAKEQTSQKILKFGEERDVFQRKISAYEAPLPNQSNLYEAVIADKIEMIMLLQSSNDELIKIKKEQQERFGEFIKQIEACKKQMHNLRLKAAQLFKAKKDLEEAKSKNQRYQQMIHDQKTQIMDLNSQLDILRLKNSESSQKMYAMSMENKNLSFKVAEYENVMKQLDIEYLNSKKTQNQKNAHILIDSVQKIQNGINSLAYYFSCCFCGELLTAPLTLAICGHNYCPKCKDAYAEYCYECDTGQPIELIYTSKFLKQTVGKYKFLVMVMKEAQTNLVKIKS